MIDVGNSGCAFRADWGTTMSMQFWVDTIRNDRAQAALCLQNAKARRQWGDDWADSRRFWYGMWSNYMRSAKHAKACILRRMGD